MSTDSELLRRYLQVKDEQAFAELVQRHMAIVFNAALRRAGGNRGLAEEATQIVFTQLACKAADLVRHGALLGWLHTCTRFTVSALIRREARLASRHQLAAAMNAHERETPDWDKLKPAVDDALDHLAPQHREAILLRYFANRSFAEIGTELNVTENAARKCVERAVEKLRRQFARRGVTTTSAALAAALVTAPAHAATAPAAAGIAASAMLAHAAANVAAPVATIAFMSSVKLTLAASVLLLVAVGGFGTAVFTWSHYQQEEERQLDALRSQASALRSRLQNRAASAAATTRSVRPPAATASPAEKGAAKMAREQNEINALRSMSPLFAPVREIEYGLRFQHEFGAFVAARGYSPEKTAALRRAMTDYYHAAKVHAAEARLSEVAAAAHAKLQATHAADLEELFEKIGAAFTASESQDIRRALEAQRVMPAVLEVGQSLGFAGAPLDRVQELALAMITVDAANAAKNASGEARQQMRAVNPQTGLSAADQRLLDDAAVFLSPRQLELYADCLRLAQVEAAAKARAREIARRASPTS